MLGFKLLFSFSVALNTFNVLALDLYSYTHKKNISLTEVNSKGDFIVLYVDENCSICKSVLKTHNNPLLYVGLNKEPSFKWVASLRRSGIDNTFVNLDKFVGKDLKSPQLYKFNKGGGLEYKVYGRTKVLEKLELIYGKI